MVQVETGQRLTHRLRFTDAAAPTRRGKPPGTIGAEVWLALAPPHEPAPPPGDSYKFLSVSSRGNLRRSGQDGVLRPAVGEHARGKGAVVGGVRGEVAV